MGFVDVDRLKDEYEGDEEILAEAIDVFFETYPEVLERVRSAVKSSDPKAVQESAHELKGMVGVFNLGELYETCKKLEYSGRENDLGESPSLLEKLEKAFPNFHQDLEAYKSNIEAA